MWETSLSPHGPTGQHCAFHVGIRCIYVLRNVIQFHSFWTYRVKLFRPGIESIANRVTAAHCTGLQPTLFDRQLHAQMHIDRARRTMLLLVQYFCISRRIDDLALHMHFFFTRNCNCNCIHLCFYLTSYTRRCLFGGIRFVECNATHDFILLIKYAVHVAHWLLVWVSECFFRFLFYYHFPTDFAVRMHSFFQLSSFYLIIQITYSRMHEEICAHRRRHWWWSCAK